MCHWCSVLRCHFIATFSFVVCAIYRYYFISWWNHAWKNNKKAERYGARNHRAMPLLHISPSSFAQNLEMFGVRSMSSVVQWARSLGNINLFNHSARTLLTDRRTNKISMAIPRFALSATKLTLELLNSCKNIKRQKTEFVFFLDMKQTGN